jgi:aldehyde decarbonylase
MLIIAALRYLNGQLWMNLSRCYYLTSKYQIQTKGITFEQVDRESSW